MSVELRLSATSIPYTVVEKAHGLQVDHVHVPVAHVAVGFLVERQVEEIVPVLAGLVQDLHEHLAAKPRARTSHERLPVGDVANHQRRALVLTALHLLQVDHVRLIVAGGARHEALRICRQGLRYVACLAEGRVGIAWIAIWKVGVRRVGAGNGSGKGVMCRETVEIGLASVHGGLGMDAHQGGITQVRAGKWVDLWGGIHKRIRSERVIELGHR